MSAEPLLDELLSPLGECFTPEVARRVAELRASPQLEARLERLGEKSNEGLLSEEERAEYETMVRFINFVSVLQSKARTRLRLSAAA